MKWIAVLLVLAACEDKTPAPSPPPAPADVGLWPLPATVNGKDREVKACGEACRAARRDACARGHAWKVTYDLGVDPIHLVVSDAGFSATEMLGRRLFGADGTVWLACLPACGEPPACVPYLLPFALGVDTDATCNTTFEGAGPAWNGHPTSLATVHCGPGQFHVTYVPELADVDAALRGAGIVGGPSFGGLTVSTSLDDGAPFMSVTEAAPSDCAPFDLPPDARVRESEDDYRRSLAVQVDLMAEMKTHATELQQQVEEALRQGGDMNEIMSRMLEGSRGLQDTGELLMRKYFDQPLCDRLISGPRAP